MRSASELANTRDRPPQRGTIRSRLDEVARRYYAPLLSFFRKRTKDPADVQDLVQQVFLRLSQHPDIGRVENPEAYIFRTASNTLTDHLRRGLTRERIVPDAAAGEEETGAHFSAERVVIGEEAIANAADALRELPERTRDVFMLRSFEGLKHAEIARLLAISVRAVEKHMAKALAHLSRALKSGE